MTKVAELEKELQTVRQQLTAASEVARWHENVTSDLKDQLQASQRQTKELEHAMAGQTSELSELRIENEQKQNQIERLTVNIKVLRACSVASSRGLARHCTFGPADPVADPTLVTPCCCGRNCTSILLSSKRSCNSCGDNTGNHLRHPLLPKGAP